MSSPPCGSDIYIDDLAMLEGEERLAEFLRWLNDQHPTIKFTANYGTRDIPYLDVNVGIKEGRIATDLYIKGH